MYAGQEGARSQDQRQGNGPLPAQWQDLAGTKKKREVELPGGAIEPGESPVAAAARELQEETSIEGHGLFHLCTLQLGSTIHHVFTTHVDDQEKPVARNEIVACKWVLRDKLSPAILNARAAELLSSQLPALTA